MGQKGRERDKNKEFREWGKIYLGNKCVYVYV